MGPGEGVAPSATDAVPVTDRAKRAAILDSAAEVKSVYLNHGKDRHKAKAAVLNYMAKGLLPIGPRRRFRRLCEGALLMWRRRRRELEAHE